MEKILNITENKLIMKTSPFFYEYFRLTWIIHKLRLLQMQGAGHEVVVLHCECPATKQMP
jgi:hypothetical protein